MCKKFNPAGSSQAPTYEELAIELSNVVGRARRHLGQPRFTEKELARLEQVSSAAMRAALAGEAS